MTIGELKRLVDQIHDLHGPDARTSFAFQKASGRIGMGDVTSYTVMLGGNVGDTVRFKIDYARGKEDGE